MIEAKRERKRKTKPDLKNRLTGLFDPVRIEFVAYLPVEECALRLESREKHSWWRSARTYVTITPVDNTVYDFYIRRERKKQGIVEAHGYLEEYEGGGTLITGEVITSFRVSGVFTVLVGIMLVALLFYFDGGLLFFACALTLGIVVDVFARMHHRHELAEMIETTLGY